MSARELAEWAGYEVYAGPLGSARFDLLAARLIHTQWNVAVAKTGKPFRRKLADFLAFGKRAKPKQSEKQMLAVLGAVASATRGL